MKDIAQPRKVHNLKSSRESLILFSYYGGAFVSFVMIFFRLMEPDYHYALLPFGSMLIIILFIFLCRKGYSQATLLFSSVVYLILAFSEGYRLKVPLQSVMYFSMIPIFFSLLIESNVIKVIYLAIWIIAFLILNLLTGIHNWVNILIYFLITPFCFGITTFFIKLLEDQERRLVLAYDDEKKNLALLEQKHQEILLFNNMMNHDLKGPLRTIRGFTSLLRAKKRPYEEQVEYLDFIENSTNNLEELISDLLILTEINTVDAEYSRVDMNLLIDQVCQSLAYDIKRQRVEFVIAELPDIYGNKEQIRMLVQNIISNAIKYQPKIEGHIPLINICYRKEGELDTIYFQDNGIGIDQKNISKLFEPFVRFQGSSEYEGTGLGMTICKKIMQKHQGDIMYVSNQSAGSCFKIQFQTSSSSLV